MPNPATLVIRDATATSYTLTRDNAAAVGLHDRGLLRVGMKADVNVIDYDGLMLRAPEILYDLPAGGKRLVQRTNGFDATIVSGAVVYRNGEATGALPGCLVREPRAAWPAAADQQKTKEASNGTETG